MVADAPILNRYRPITVIGEGASGTVEICWDTRIMRRVAIKHLPLGAQAEGQAVPGLAEARTAAMLTHPSIVSVIDFEVADDEALLIMEAIEGPTVAQLIEDDPDHMLSLDVACAVLESVGEALDFAHENQVLHLDIKPENILVDMAGHVKVSDFGVSELADANGFGCAGGGTLGYMPPEQMLGQDLDQRCDEFALAAVVYEMLTGENPFSANSIDESIDLIEQFDIAAPSEYRDDVDSRIDAAILTALDPSRDMRFETVLEFVDELSPLLGSARQGVLELKELASIDDESIEADEQQSSGRRARLGGSGSASRVLRRLVPGVLCCLIVALGLVNSSLVSLPIALAAGAVCGIVAIFLPTAGALIALALYGGCFIASALPFLSATLNSPAGLARLLLGIAWLISAVLMCWACTRNSRVSSVIGMLGVSVVLFAAVFAAQLVTSDAPAALEYPWVITAAIASILMTIGTAALALHKRKEQ